MTRNRLKTSVKHRSGCPLASALDILGDKWSLLIVRGLFTGCRRYGDFLKEPEGIATNILAGRLRLLETDGVLEKFGGQPEGGAIQYRLTRKGAELLPALQALARWGFAHIEGRWHPLHWFMKGKPRDFYPKD